MQAHAVDALHRLPHMLDQALEIGRGRIAVVDDEVRVFLGHRGVADPEALQVGGVDEPRGVIARRVGEHRAAAPFTDRLRRLAALEQLADLLFIHSVGALKLQSRGYEPFLGYGRDHLAVADFELARRAGALLAVAIDGLDFDDVAPRLAAERTGVHGERTAQRPGDPGEKLGRTEPPLHALLGDTRAGDAGLAVDIR